MLPPKKDKLGCATLGSKIFMFGGFGPQSSGSNETYMLLRTSEFIWYNDVHVLDTETMRWSLCVPDGMPPSRRSAMGIAIVKNVIFIFGGRESSSRTNDLHALELNAGFCLAKL
eukprot:TRINITY_DN1894_c0_g1_i2.p1 TRINITY_DN1894_c0_g1~~TRINITY_DN1894_c0_g1_i2.p1  ORF type:complete len:114 (-),score=18.15 TRINITY_DN1894_c0_g1_i2:393-734(-)